MIGYYNYTVILTYLGTVSGFTGITYIWRGNVKASLICLMLAGFCDMFDGKVASTMKRTRQEKRFGVQIDSLSDLICFGVLPALIIWYCAGEKFIPTIIAATYVLCALIRLAWFNVDEEERQSQEEGSRETYLGLPVTTAALIFPFVMGSMMCLHMKANSSLSWVGFGVAIAFLTPFKIKKPGNIGKMIMVIIGALTLALVMLGGKL